MANLRWTPADPDTNDVDLDAGLVRVLGKGRRERLLSIGMKTVKSLDRYLRLREDHAAAATPWLWLGLKGRLTDSGIAQMVADRGRAAGLGDSVQPPPAAPHLRAHCRGARSWSCCPGDRWKCLGARTLTSSGSRRARSVFAARSAGATPWQEYDVDRVRFADRHGPGRDPAG